jgi:ribose transport system substrate-binding protein
LAVAALAAVALAGCGSSSTEASGETSHSKVQGSTAFNKTALGQLQAKITVALKGKDLSRVKIAMVTNSTSDYWKEAQAGWNKAITDLHVQAVFQQPTQSQASLQVSILQTLATQGYTGYGVSAIEPPSLVKPISQAVAQGMNVIAFDSPLPSTKASFYIGTPNTTPGYDAGKAMSQALGGKGDVVAITGSLTAANSIQRINGFKQGAGSGIKVVQVLNDNEDKAAAVSDLQTEFQSNPNIKGIYAVYSYEGGSAAQAVRAVGKVGSVQIIADDGEPDPVTGVKSGVITASVLQRPYDQGLMLAYCLTAIKVLGTQQAMALMSPYFTSDNTLSTAASGGALAITKGHPVTGISNLFSNISLDRFYGIPLPLILFAVVAAAAWFVLERTYAGRETYAVGGNREAARLAGIRVSRRIVTTYVVSGTCAGLVAILIIGRIASGDPNAGNGYELDAIAVAVIGGVSLFGGQGRLIGIVAGAVLLEFINSALIVLNVWPFYQQIALGLVLGVAIIADRIRTRHQGRARPPRLPQFSAAGSSPPPAATR